jgi:serine/threonine protein kinase
VSVSDLPSPLSIHASPTTITTNAVFLTVATPSSRLDYAAPEILEGKRYMGKEQDVWAFGVVAFVLLVGECPFASKGEAHVGLGPAPPSMPPSPAPETEEEQPMEAFFDSPGLTPLPTEGHPTKAGRALIDRCNGTDPETGMERSFLGLEPDCGGGLGDAAGLVRACLQVDPAARPSFDEIMRCKFLNGGEGWTEWIPGWTDLYSDSPPPATAAPPVGFTIHGGLPPSSA